MKTYKTIVDKNTGELLDNRVIEANDTDIILINVLSEKEAENQLEFAKNKKKLDAEIKDFIKNNEGAYIHLIFKYGTTIFKELESKAPGNKANIHIIRFIILATYQTFGGNLFDSSKHRIKKSSLKKIWDTDNRNGINETYNLLLECGYIYETEGGYIMLNDELVIKGAIDNFKDLKKEDNDMTYTRVFIDNIKDMYYGTEPKQRKQLANLFKILPYINYKFNAFCTNPTETDETKLDLMTWTDLARICGYEENKNISKFKKDLMKLKIHGHDVIGCFERSSGMTIIVNPKVYYGGDDVKDVEWLYKLFRMNPKK